MGHDNLKVKQERVNNNNKKKVCDASRRCLANNLPVLISTAGLGELAL